MELKKARWSSKKLIGTQQSSVELDKARWRSMNLDGARWTSVKLERLDLVKFLKINKTNYAVLNIVAICNDYVPLEK